MDMSDKDKLELDKRGDTPLNYHSPGNMTSDMPLSCANITSSSLGLIPTDNQMPVCTGGLLGSSCSSSSMVDSFGPGLWDHSTNSLNLGFCDINVQTHPNASNPIGDGKGGPPSSRCGIDKTLEMGWNVPSLLLRGGIFLPSVSEVLPQSLSHFPADSAFIERAARFSCFNGGNFNDMVNAFGIPESMGLYSRGGCIVQGPQEVFGASGLKSVAGDQLKNEGKTECLVKSNDEAKQGVGGSGNESEEAELSGSGGQEETCMLEGNGVELSAKSVGLKKRKRNGQDVELDQAMGNKHSVETAKDDHEGQQNGDQTPTSTPNKTTAKQGSHGSDPPKEEYIHVRARRGQATNSHSLAERVRREKISERMKLLQGLVPGCSKVTGKAVMLDEIINYVQSLQRQVEFLSMKLATVNPRLDFNTAGLLGKDILHSRAVPSTLPFSPDLPMAYPPLNASQSGLIAPSFLGFESHSDVLRRTFSSQSTPLSGGFKEPNQLPNAWNDELRNVVQMGYGTNTTQDDQDVNAGSLLAGHMKAEL